MSYTNFSDLSLVSILSNRDAKGENWVPVSNSFLDKVSQKHPVIANEVAYLKVFASLFGVNYEEAGNTFLLKAPSGNVVERVYGPRVQVDEKGQLVVAWGTTLTLMDPSEVGVLGQPGVKYGLKQNDKSFFLVATPEIVDNGDMNEYEMEIAVKWEDGDPVIKNAKILNQIIQGQNPELTLSDVLFCQAGLAQKIAVLDENASYKVLGYEIKKNKFNGNDVIMLIEGIGKVRAQGNCKKLLMVSRPDVTETNPATLYTYEKTERKNANGPYIQLSNRLTLPQAPDFEAFEA